MVLNDGRAAMACFLVFYVSLCVREIVTNYGVLVKRYLWMLLCNTVVNTGP